MWLWFGGCLVEVNNCCVCVCVLVLTNTLDNCLACSAQATCYWCECFHHYAHLMQHVPDSWLHQLVVIVHWSSATLLCVLGAWLHYSHNIWCMKCCWLCFHLRPHAVTVWLLLACIPHQHLMPEMLLMLLPIMHQSSIWFPCWPNAFYVCCLLAFLMRIWCLKCCWCCCQSNINLPSDSHADLMHCMYDACWCCCQLCIDLTYDSHADLMHSMFTCCLLAFLIHIWCKKNCWLCCQLLIRLCFIRVRMTLLILCSCSWREAAVPN